jgi:type II secretory pathway component PulF
MATQPFPTLPRILRREWRRSWSTWATRAESAAVLRLVAASAAAGVPAATILDAWAEDSRGGQGTRLEKAAGHLRQGATASEAATRVPGLIQGDHATALAFGERIGLIGPVVQAALSGDDLLDHTPRRGLRMAIGHLAVMVVILLIVATYVFVRIYPQLQKILDDFGTPRPDAFEAWRLGSFWISNYWWTAGAILAPLGVLRCFPAGRGLLARPFARQRRITAAVDALSVADACGRPIAEAAATLADFQVDPAIARGLRQAAAPGPLGRQLADAGLLSAAEASAIDSAGSDRPNALERLAASRRDRSRRRLIAASDAVAPCIAFAMGFLVFFQARAVFSCLCAMIEMLS